MSRKFAIKVLEEKGEVVIRGAGNSMQPIIYTGNSIFLKRVLPQQLRVGDAVFCKVKNSIFVHKIVAIDEKEQKYTIANNSGFINGKISPSNIFGLCVRVEDKILITEEELIKRL